MKFRKFMIIVVFLFTITLVTGCNGNDGKLKVTGIEADKDSFMSSVSINEYDVRDWFIKINYNDGSSDLVSVTFNMLSTADFKKLTTIGTHTLTFTYESFTFEHQLTVTEPSAEEKENLFISAMRDDLIKSTITESFVLPQTHYDVEISWKVDSPYISISGTRAIVTRPAMGSLDETVTLTATFTLYGETRTRTYDVVVVASGKEELMEHLDEVVKYINVPSTISKELDLLFSLDDVEISWESSNTNVILIDNNTKSAIVNPVLTETKVTLTYSFSYKTLSFEDYGSIDVTVIPETIVTKAPNVSNLKVNEDVLSWNSISGISKYNVYSNDKLLASVSVNSIDLSKYIKKAGTYTIGVEVVASGAYNTNSDIVTTSYTLEESGVIYEGSYYDSVNLLVSGSSLKSTLRTLTQSTHKSIRSYEDLKKDIAKADVMLNDSTKVLGFWSRVPLKAAWSSGGTIWNREHVWPQSQGWFTTSGAGSDLHHIRPTDPSVNGAHGNTPYGEVNGGTPIKMSTGASSGCYKANGYFEPQDESKGDTARIIFYLLVRYSESDSYPITNVAKSYAMLLEWNELDPVDEWEMNRNDVSESIQGNRNPFIDYPELADEIWG